MYFSVLACINASVRVCTCLCITHGLQNQEQNRRVSVLGKLLHHTVKFPANQNTDQQAVHSNQLRLFITDHSLQSSSSEDHASSAAEHGSALSCGQSSQCGSGLPAYVAVEVRQCCVADSLQPQPAVHTGDSVSVVLLRDLWIHKGKHASTCTHACPCTFLHTLARSFL